MMTGKAATLALQQCLGSVIGKLAKPANEFHTAKSKATLTEAFEASQDALDQMGRAYALQHSYSKYC
jgi:hypothetical protein